MPCVLCGTDLELTATSGGVDGGRFVEEYRCPGCGASGEVRGESSDPPGEWRRLGRLFG